MVLDDTGVFVRVNGAYRVTDVMINGEPLELNRTYTVASHNYMIKEGSNDLTTVMPGAIFQEATSGKY